MYTIPIVTSPDGEIAVASPIPSDAICTITTPDGCEVYLEGDEPMLAIKLGACS